MSDENAALNTEANGGPDTEPDTGGGRREPRCAALRHCCANTTRPFRTKYNPLPHEPSFGQQLKYNLLCPPHGKLARYLMFVLMFGVCWAVMISITGSQGLPGGNFFSLLILFFTCALGGYLVSFIRLPPLLGKRTIILKKKCACIKHELYE